MANRGLGQLFLRKSVEQMHAEHEGGELKKSFGPLNLVFLGIGCIIGTGIFVLTGRAAAEYAGPAIMISFVLTGILCAFVALSYSELAAAIPVSGSAYSYSYASMGEFVAWIMGVLLLLEYGVAASTVAVGWSGNVVSLLTDMGIHLPHALSQPPGALVATHDLTLTAVDPTVGLSGVTAVLDDGTKVIFGKGATGVLSGSFPVKFDEYSVVGTYALDVTEQNVATLASNATVTLADTAQGATAGTRDLAANTAIHFAGAAKAVIPASGTAALTAGQTAASMVNLPALIGIVGVTLLLAVGVSESATVNNAVVVIKVTVVLAFIIIGAFYVKTELWSPLIPPQDPPPPPGSDMSMGGQIWRALGDVVTGQNTAKYGVGGIIAGAASIFFAYIGFEAVSTAGAEAKNPARDMPIGILGSLIICTILYILTCAVLVGIMPYNQLNDPAPLAKAVDSIPDLKWFAVLIKVGAIAGLSSVMLVLLYGQTRIFYSMARDGLLPKVFSTVNAKTKTPVVNTLVVGVVAACFAGFTGLDFLGDATNVGTLVAFALICLTVIYLRFARPDLNRPFKMPGWLAITIALAGAVMCFILFMSLMSKEGTRNFFIPYIVVGILFYFVYGMWNSKLAKGQKVTGHEPNPDLGATGTQRPE
jgi:APA family basic amino acid/polyamine antiporter